MKLLVQPAYGWGWHTKEGVAADVPGEFELEATVLREGDPFDVALGQVRLAEHPLAEAWILLQQRHSPSDGNCNLMAFLDRPRTLGTSLTHDDAPHLTGFALVLRKQA